MEASASAHVADEAKRHLQDCSRVAVFDGKGAVLYANCKVLPGEPQQLAASFEGRDAAMSRGLRLEGRRYEVHRYHPPLVYGRSMVDCEPEQSTGIAVCRVDRSRLGARPCYIAVTYEQPQTSARIVPRLVAFAQQHLEAP
ncbi:hypothetical protein CHLNCDRAFT_145521 [Chlorella variabilis]|uniref:Profilin n=1 Tax=Chlorella variabilis TaxID=554065 RepID=E1ZDP1_CHLVA|nr:hypothetical protein CHLNCDRAFT_145521 [Chlorella variabilis]EFN56055.1 hypothetical protein CHLNCDRAFT_145521 [Chlorella variabilis]|eukprot:XP_005848157.1 hypothetical protein CHLNCDRAFT_145521 [Chlorella variabilis]